MNNFIYYAPTKVYFGKDEHKKIGEIVRGYGYKKIMIQYGQGSVKKSGLYDTVVNSLKENSVSYVEMGGVEPNPKVEFVREAVKKAKEEKVELILAVGGGSVIDSSKTTAVGAMTDYDIWEYSMGKRTPEAALDVGCILTHAAAGSEMSSSAVLTNLKLNMKKGFNSEHNRCKFAILDPCLTYTVSQYQTACGIVDIMAHTMERYFTVCPPVMITDSIAEAILKTVIKSGRVLMENPKDYDARANVMWASSLSHNDLTGCGRENTLAVHQLEHALSGKYDNIAHGAGLAVLFPAWAKFVYKANVKRFAQFARNVWDVDEADDEKAAQKGIMEMQNFFKLLKMPSSLGDFNIGGESINELSDLCTFSKTRKIKSFIELDYDNVKEIFKICL